MDKVKLDKFAFTLNLKEYFWKKLLNIENRVKIYVFFIFDILNPLSTIVFLNSMQKIYTTH